MELSTRVITLYWRTTEASLAFLCAFIHYFTFLPRSECMTQDRFTTQTLVQGAVFGIYVVVYFIMAVGALFHQHFDPALRRSFVAPGVVLYSYAGISCFKYFVRQNFNYVDTFFGFAKSILAFAMAGVLIYNMYRTVKLYPYPEDEEDQEYRKK